ncbi:hypothetical protein HPC49_01730 [Pyxidicoccus fallax]|uniref:Lipoprotein n=1 Tax=Pyxidicoccus fallax TaxID=394095 RepID=A0A848LFU3_9BACT|nr:hypothetical protein [Pyxidicoccus fallax]NMO16013.1 hypothetical protein [Pyxidicoccus fallax]NPC76974.1 hypothetical protein [Pyxidicoccus fallax]
MIQSRFVSVRGAFVLLGMLFTAACGGPLEEEGGTATPEEPAVSEEVARPEVTGLAYTCGETQGTCPTGSRCCYPCGVPDCQWQCMAGTRCPIIP